MAITLRQESATGATTKGSAHGEKWRKVGRGHQGIA